MIAHTTAVGRARPWRAMPAPRRPALLTMLLCVCVLAGSVLDAGASERKKRFFERSDKNKDGVVSREEYRARMVEVFYSADADRDGTLVMEELIDVYPARFVAADQDGDGLLTLEEFQAFRAKDFEDADADDDGVLSWEEAF